MPPSGTLTVTGPREVEHLHRDYESTCLGYLTAPLLKLGTFLTCPWTRSCTSDWYTLSAHPEFVSPFTITRSRKDKEMTKIEFITWPWFMTYFLLKCQGSNACLLDSFLKHTFSWCRSGNLNNVTNPFLWVTEVLSLDFHLHRCLRLCWGFERDVML